MLKIDVSSKRDQPHSQKKKTATVAHKDIPAFSGNPGSANRAGWETNPKRNHYRLVQLSSSSGICHSFLPDRGWGEMDHLGA